MAIREILVHPDERLRRATKQITVFDEKLKALVDDMFETMYDADGIGLAAPQIGVSQKLVVIDIVEEVKDSEDVVVSKKHNKLVLINPRIIEKKGEQESQEGCLSVPEIYEKVNRATNIKYEYQDLEGQTHQAEADGLLAVCIQHELDHLEGRLFVDYLSSLKQKRILKRLDKLKKEHAFAE